MTDCQQSNKVLINILAVLERIEENLAKLDNRFEHLDNIKTAISTPRSDIRETEVHENGSVIECELNCDHDDPDQSGVIAAPSSHPPKDKVEVSRIQYSKWSSNEQHQELEVEVLEKHLSDCWRLPSDNRLPLIFFRNSLQGTYQHRNKVDVGLRLDFLHRFDANFRSRKGNDFLVVDFDLANNTRLYRIGERAIGNELMVESNAKTAPWSRLM